MAALPLFADADFWRAALEEDAEFRACMEKVVGDLEVSVDVPALEASFSLSVAIDLRVDRLRTRLEEVQQKIPCFDFIIAHLEAEGNPEAAAWRTLMLTQRSALQVEQLSIASQLAVLPAFSASTKEATDNLIASGKNASFLGGILDSLSPGGGA